MKKLVKHWKNKENNTKQEITKKCYKQTKNRIKSRFESDLFIKKIVVKHFGFCFTKNRKNYKIRRKSYELLCG